MKKLTRVLEGLCKERGWILSSVDEAGEGEHKVIRWLKKMATKGDTCIVYGLDADLILLNMLVSEIKGLSIFLLREKQEFGSASASAAAVAAEQEYTFMNLDEFKRRMGITNYQDIVNYVALMTLMGNDFLPHSLTHKLNDDGHDCVLTEFREMKRSGHWLVVEDKIEIGILGQLCKRWSGDEGARMEKMIRGKREQAGRGVGRGMDPSEALPLEWDV
jgi:5'-3' exonuclease